MPLLGSDERMRGYYQGRYRDKNVVSGQLEYRRQLTWRHGIVAWAGAGTMGPSLSSLNNGRWLRLRRALAYRFEFKPRVNVRLDYGIGNGSSGFTSRSAKRFNASLPLIFSPYRLLSGPLRAIFMNCSFCDPNCSTTQ